jgi:drug/metabolite transporter (DMT)-like permease
MTHSNDNTNLTRPLLTLVFGASCISFAAVFVKMLGVDKMGPSEIGLWRTLLGSIILFAFAAMGRVKLGISPVLFRYSILAGFIFFLDMFFWHRSILDAGVGMATILANTQVFATAVLSFFIFKERLRTGFYIAALVGLAGVVLLIGVGSGLEFTSIYLRGVGLGLLTGLAYANYLVTIRRARLKAGATSGSVAFMAWTSLFSAIFLGLAVLVEGGVWLPPDLPSWGILTLLALVAQALGWWAISSSLSSIPASHSGLVLLLQPILATLWGVLFFAEHLTVIQLLGAAVTLVAIYVGSLYTSRSRKSH